MSRMRNQWLVIRRRFLLLKEMREVYNEGSLFDHGQSALSTVVISRHIREAERWEAWS